MRLLALLFLPVALSAQYSVVEKSISEMRAALDRGYNLDGVITTDDLVRGDNVFFAATGVTDGELLRGVRYEHGGARTQSLVMRSKSGTVRMIDARHRIDKLSSFAAVDY